MLTNVRPPYQTVRSHPASARHPEGHLGLPVLEVDSVFCPYGAPLTPKGWCDAHLVCTGNSIWDGEEEIKQEFSSVLCLMLVFSRTSFLRKLTLSMSMHETCLLLRWWENTYCSYLIAGDSLHCPSDWVGLNSLISCLQYDFTVRLFCSLLLCFKEQTKSRLL